jgi:hypothetical protein
VFLDQCRTNLTNGNTNDTVWLVASNADSDPDKNVDVLHNMSDFENNRVQSLIMISDLYNRPANDSEIYSISTPQSLMSMMTKHAPDFQKYSWNYQTTKSYPYYVSLTHEYIDRCYLLDVVKYIILGLGTANLLVTLVWIYYVWKKWGANS